MTNMSIVVSVMVLETDGMLKLENWGEFNQMTIYKVAGRLRETNKA